MIVIILIVLFLFIEYYNSSKENFSDYTSKNYTIPNLVNVFSEETNDVDDALCQSFFRQIKTNNNLQTNLSQNSVDVYNNLTAILYNVLVGLVEKVDTNTINKEISNLSKECYNCIEAPIMKMMANCGSNISGEIGKAEDQSKTSQAIQKEGTSTIQDNLMYINPSKTVKNNVFKIPFSESMSFVSVLNIPEMEESINKPVLAFSPSSVITYVNSYSDFKNVAYTDNLSMMPFCAIMYNHVNKKYKNYLLRINSIIDICNKTKKDIEKLSKLSNKTIDISQFKCLDKNVIPNESEYIFLSSPQRIKDKTNKSLLIEIWNNVIEIQKKLGSVDSLINNLKNNISEHHKLFKKLEGLSCKQPNAWSKPVTLAALGKKCNLN